MKEIFGLSIGCVNNLVSDINRNAYIDLIRGSNLPINALEDVNDLSFVKKRGLGLDRKFVKTTNRRITIANIQLT